MYFLVTAMSLLRSSMRCARRSPGVARRPVPRSGSVVRSWPGRSGSVLEYTRLLGRAETHRPDLLPGTGAFVRSPHAPAPVGERPPLARPDRAESTGADGPRSDVGPGARSRPGTPLQLFPALPTGRGAAELHGAHRPGGARPRCSPKHRGHPWVRPSHQDEPTVAARPSRVRRTCEEPLRADTEVSLENPGGRASVPVVPGSAVFRCGTTSSPAPSDGLGHGLPMATFAALTIVEGASFPLRRDASRL